MFLSLAEGRPLKKKNGCVIPPRECLEEQELWRTIHAHLMKIFKGLIQKSKLVIIMEFPYGQTKSCAVWLPQQYTNGGVVNKLYINGRFLPLHFQYFSFLQIHCCCLLLALAYSLYIDVSTLIAFIIGLFLRFITELSCHGSTYNTNPGS